MQLGHALPGRDAIVVPSGPSPATLAEGLGSREEADRWWSLMGPLGRRAEDVVATALSDQRSVPHLGATAALGAAFVRAHPRGVVGDPLGPDGRTRAGDGLGARLRIVTRPAGGAASAVRRHRLCRWRGRGERPKFTKFTLAAPGKA